MTGNQNTSGYPPGFFEALYNLAPRRERAWDVGAGLGDVTARLADGFDEILASEVNSEYCAHAVKRGNIHYLVERAEETQLPSRSIDLVAVCQTLHHLQLDAFYTQVRRVLRSDGVLAVWCIGAHKIDRRVESMLDPFYQQVSPYWLPDRQIVTNGYRDLPFPFQESKPPGRFNISAGMSFDDFLAYLGSWTAVRRYRSNTGLDPFRFIPPETRLAWKAKAAVQKVRWPVHMRVGRLAKC